MNFKDKINKIWNNWQDFHQLLVDNLEASKDLMDSTEEVMGASKDLIEHTDKRFNKLEKRIERASEDIRSTLDGFDYRAISMRLISIGYAVVALLAFLFGLYLGSSL